MEEEERRNLLREVFGDSSGSENDELYGEDQPPSLQIGLHSILHGYRSHPQSLTNPSWERIGGVNGLRLCRGFLSPDHQSSLLSAVENEGYFTEASHNQAMRFGDLPAWATELSDHIRELVLFSDFVSELGDLGTCDGDKDGDLLPSDLLWRDPLFDQLIINVYQPGEGICAHIDLMRFDDGIAIISLESSCVMHFSRSEEETCEVASKRKEDLPKTKTQLVYLTPGSLVFMWGEARYLWKHEINRKPGFQVWEGQEIEQKKRTSITLRKLCRTE